MAVAYSATGNASGKKVNSLTISSLVVSGSDLAIYVFICAVRRNDGAPLASGVAWDAVGVNEAFTDLGSLVRSGRTEYVHVWRLVGPTAKTADVTVTFPNNQGTWAGGVAGAHVLTGVDSGTPDDGRVAAEGATSPATVDVTSTDDDLVVDGVVTNQQTVTAGGSQTQHWNVSEDNTESGGSDEDGTGTITMSWTFTNTDWVTTAINVNAAVAATANPVIEYMVP